MNFSDAKKQMTQTGSRWGVLVLTFVLLGAPFVPGCKFESCADTNTCKETNDDEPSLGGQGGAGGSAQPEEMPQGMGGDKDGEEEEEEDPSPDPDPIPVCDEGEVLCDTDCIDPATDAGFCGARGACDGDSAGEVCGEGELCVEGSCELDCPSGEVACDGSCIDPLTNDEFCGANEACEEFSACEPRQQCISGTCAAWTPADVVDFGVAASGAANPGQVTIDGAGEVRFAWAQPDSEEQIDARTSQLVLDPMLWSAPAVLDSHTSDVGEIRMATNSSGRTVIIWSQPSAALEPVVWATVRDPGADFSEPVVISGVEAGAFNTFEVYSLALTQDDEGNAYAVWIEGQNPSDVLAVSRLAAGESEWSRPVEIRIDEDVVWSARTPLVQSLDGGEALILFERAKPEGGWAWYTITSEDGKFGGSEFGTAQQAFETTQPGYSFGQSMAANGEEAVLFWVAYAGYNGPQFGLMSFYRDGAWTEPAQIETPGGPNLFRTPQVAMDAQGNITAAWISGALTSSLWSAHREVGSEEWIFTEDAVALGTTETTFPELLLSLDGLGNAQLAWIQDAGGSPSVWASRRRAGSADFEVPRLLENSGVSAANLAMDFNESGQGILTWWTTTGTERTLGFSYFH